MAQKIESPKQPAIVPHVPSGTAIGQNSPHQPAVVYDRARPGLPVYTPMYHMVFTSNDGTNSILYATSPDGYNNWTLGPAPGQTSGAAPALAQYFVSTYESGGIGGVSMITTNLLVLVFVATNLSNRIQYAMLDLMEDPNYRAWRFGGSLARNFGKAVSVCPQFFESQSGNVLSQGTQVLTVYYTSNDSSNRLLETSFNPQ